VVDSGFIEKPSAISVSQRVTDTLFALTQSSSPISVRTIAEATGNSRSSAHRILQTLAESGFAEQRADGGYTIGPRLVELSARVFGSVPVLRIADSIMTQLVDTVGETCYLATYVPGEMSATFIHRVESDEVVRHIQALGTRIPLHAGAVGKAILSVAAVDLEELSLVGFTEKTPTTLTSLRRDVDEAKRRGYATSVSERVLDVVGVASPVFSGERVVGGLTVAIPSSRVPADGLERIGEAVRQHAAELSAAFMAMGVKRL
jgi:IclR family acetate operon transcriptional repressor